MPFHLSNLGILLVLIAQMIAIAITIISGDFRVGYLKKSVELAMPKAESTAFWEVMLQRLEELGFKPSDLEGRYLQGGLQDGIPGSGTHARTSKALMVQFRESASEEVVATVTLGYLDPIVGDTGESAYRDGVLDYVTGKTDRMVLVPNRSLLAVTSLTGGVLACLLAGAIVGLKRWSFWIPLLVLTTTEIIVGLLGLWAALRKPTEITGKSAAAAGICLSLAAMTITFYAMHGELALHGAQ